MTVAVIIAGLLPVLWGTGAGSEVMSRITAPLLSLFIIPAAYKLMWLRRHRRLAANVCRPPAAVKLQAGSVYAYRPSALTRLRYSPGVQPNSRTNAL
ncbi:AcrB/AcrD/AcrF family protein [Salmonella enterica]|uniref:Cation transporter n=1 Tax=Salmonella enterica I TaxID=59201 RepID=A0A5Y2KHD9_SALET|nr:AcrB/AcrD/AcrF family protein [Salmonella enterica]EBU7444156.1 cation transporter [Salmonella enterica subsp. enterica serovar Bovismorbificans]EAB3748028.1 AcrB/AcrD/AcrF family protein [Salmonella enterica]EAM4877480.1 AcrB/AcrD/AcrF family protein [Salmonella enterica]EAM6990698.1 AcrB/AcrD/AcrF family protein [Salmonella enterica]